MKKYMLPGLIAAVALSLPLAAQAQTSPVLGTQQQTTGTMPYTTQQPDQSNLPAAGIPSPITPGPEQVNQGTTANPNMSTQQTPMTPYSNQTGQINTPNTGVSSQQSPLTPYSNQTGQVNTPNTGVSSQQMPMTPNTNQTGQVNTPNTGVSNQQTTTQTTVSQNQSSVTQLSSGTYTPTSGDVIVGADTASSIVPPLTIGMGTTTINVVNPTPKPVSFTIPALNLTYEVPANSERTVQIDRTQTASLTPGQSVAYYVNDANGNQIASSNLTNNQTLASQINTNTQVAEEQTKTEPSYQANSTPSSTSRRRSTVRGYW